MNPWKERIRTLRGRLDLDQEEMGRRLGVSREWVSKLERGHEEPSQLMVFKLEAMEKAFELSGLHRTEAGFTKGKTRESADPAAALRQKIEDHIAHLIAVAGGDVQRLGWIAEQLDNHLVEPGHWGVHERVAKRVAAAQAAQQAAPKAPPHSGGGRTHEGAA